MHGFLGLKYLLGAVGPTKTAARLPCSSFGTNLTGAGVAANTHASACSISKTIPAVRYLIELAHEATRSDGSIPTASGRCVVPLLLPTTPVAPTNFTKSDKSLAPLVPICYSRARYPADGYGDFHCQAATFRASTLIVGGQGPHSPLIPPPPTHQTFRYPVSRLNRSDVVRYA